MVISSRTPEGEPNRCPVCGNTLRIEPSDPAGDAPCPHCGHLLWFTRELLGDVQVIRLTGDRLQPGWLDRLFEAIKMRPRMRLVLDLGDVPYLSSAVLSKLIHLQKVGAVRGKVRLRNLRPDLREVMRVSRLDLVFEIEE
jgi:anti-anti-sigma factor